MWTPKDVVRQPLYVVCCVFNPVRFKSRYKAYQDFQRHVRESGAILVTIEAAFGEREFALEDHAPASVVAPEPDFKSHGPANVPHAARMPHSRAFQDYIKISVGQQQEIWLKENLLNVACQHLPEDAKYVAFVDADIHFSRPDWVSETLHALQHYDVVQMFTQAVSLSSQYETTQASYGYAWCHVHGVRRKRDLQYYGAARLAMNANTWHTGFAWAWRRSALNAVGGLIEHGILGAGDNHMARCLFGRGEDSINSKLTPGYRQRVLTWQRRAVEHIKGNVGYIDGAILHYYHGRLFNRRYGDRWKILIEHQFDPDHDMKKDWRGVIQLTDRKPKLRDDIRLYFRARDEDSIDHYPGDGRLLGPSPATR